MNSYGMLNLFLLWVDETIQRYNKLRNSGKINPCFIQANV